MSQFLPGQSGNPVGRPKGSVSKQLTALRDAADQVLPLVLERALAGDADAQKLIIERGMPKMKPVTASEPIALPEGKIPDQLAALLQQVASGDVSSEAAGKLLALMTAAAQLVLTGRKAGLDAERKPPDYRSGGSTYLNAVRKTYGLPP